MLWSPQFGMIHAKAMSHWNHIAIFITGLLYCSLVIGSAHHIMMSYSWHLYTSRLLPVMWLFVNVNVFLCAHKFVCSSAWDEFK